MLIPASSGVAPNHSDFAAARALFQCQPKEEQSGLEQSGLLLTLKPPNEMKR